MTIPISFLMILLAYNSYTGDTLWYLHVSKIYFSWIYSLIILFLSPYLEQFQQISFFYFHI
jgi:hypothetical protein